VVSINLMNLRALLIGHDPADARVVRDALAETTHEPFALEWVGRLSDGLERLRRNGIAVVLIDLRLPDSQGLAGFEQLLEAFPHVPILILSSAEDEDIARQAVRRGARDYLLKDHIHGQVLRRTLRHIVESNAADEAFFSERERAEITLNSIGDAVISTDVTGKITYLNAVAERMTGWSRKEAFGQPFLHVFRIVDGVTRETAGNPMELAIRLDKTVNLTPNCTLIRRDGFASAIEDSAAPIHARNGRVIGAVIVFHDVSVARAQSLRISHLAQHDTLTDLPNRTLLNDRLTQAIGLSRRHDERLAVLFLDLDGFKHVNDSLGHVIGDQLLQSTARRLTTCVRGSDTVSRQGGDEFVVLLPEIRHADDAAATAQKILTALTAVQCIAENDLHVTASIGVSMYPDDGQDADALLKCADTAMYHAKESGRNNYQFFKPDMNARAVERQQVEAGLRRALDRNEFVLHYQPTVDLETGAMTGAEALIRWVHSDRGLIYPIEFVRIAEACGLIVPIGQWVLRGACAQARAWIDEGQRPVTVAVNISAVEFRHPHFLDNVCKVLRDTRLAPRYLELELTESSLMQHPDSSAPVLQALKDMGIQIAIDDFGTGYSSLSYLRRFPIDVLKIDQSFVREISADPVGTSIVCAVIGMGKSLGHRIIAEGVETREQLAFLQGQQCGEGQGYYFSRPVVAHEFAKLMDTGIRETSSR
jgi:diguanylate cyclase (GGDEF)-like protein/PAS domain S-box-containing protein